MEQVLNILWITHEYPPIGGGGATACRSLAREFAVPGHSVTVVTAGLNNGELRIENGELGTDDVGADIIRPQAKGIRYVFQYETVDGVDIYRLKCKRAKKDSSSFFEMLSFLWAAFRFAPGLVKEINKDNRKFDIAIISFGIPGGPLGCYLKKRYKLPYIVRLGGGDVPGTQKRFTFLYAVLSPVLKVIWKNASYVVANSQGLMERATAFYSKAKFYVIHNGADTPLIENGKLKMEYEKTKKEDAGAVFRIATTARIVERKGIQHVVEALPQLAEATDRNIRYTVIGDGPYRSAIEALAERLGVSGYLEITGMIPHEEVIACLKEADVFALMSHWEGMPNAVIEAMAAGLPIIMSNCEGSGELVDGNGYVVNNGDNIASEIAEKVLLLYNDRQMAANLGEMSYKRVCGNFRWEKSAKEYLKLIEGSILSGAADK